MKTLPIPVLLASVIVISLMGCYLSYDVSPPPRQVETSKKQSSEILVSDFCLGGCPIGGAGDDQLVVHHIYELNNNLHTKFADWVAYKITPNTLGKGCKRIWKMDPDIGTGATLDPEDYKGIREALRSDRGHQAPLASLCGSPYWEEADYLSNITPQKSDLNEGPWERLENAERSLINQGITNSVYSVTGPLYERVMPPLPHAHAAHSVPSGYWKIISINIDGHLIAAAFAMDQTIAKEANFCESALSIEDVEKRTHLSFFSKLQADEKAALDHTQSEMMHDLSCK
jgi:endonuclease G